MGAETSYQEFLQVLGKTIRDYRKDRGYTQLELATRAKRNQSSVAKVESAPPADLSLRVIYELAHGLSINVSDLMRAAEVRSLSHIPEAKEGLDAYWKTIKEIVETLPDERKTYVKRVIFEVVSGATKLSAENLLPTDSADNVGSIP